MKINEIITEANTGLTFYGSPCTQDCSGHIAGYKWAKKKALTKKPHPMDPRTPSFNNGVGIGAAHQEIGRHPISTGIRGQKGQYQKFKPIPRSEYKY